MTDPSHHPSTPDHLPVFFTAPGNTDVLMVFTALFVIGMVLLVGVLFFWMHTLPERLAHRGKKFQFEIVALLGLISLFTHQHIFWIAGLLLAFIELPDFSTPLGRMVGALEKIAGINTDASVTEVKLKADPHMIAGAAKPITETDRHLPEKVA